MYHPRSDSINNFPNMKKDIFSNPLLTNAFMVILAGDMIVNINGFE